jgi:hypothetical protein
MRMNPLTATSVAITAGPMLVAPMVSDKSTKVPAPFHIVQTEIRAGDDEAIFRTWVRDAADAEKPTSIRTAPRLATPDYAAEVSATVPLGRPPGLRSPSGRPPVVAVTSVSCHRSARSDSHDEEPDVQWPLLKSSADGSLLINGALRGRLAGRRWSVARPPAAA